jgi:ribosomal protein S6
MTKHAENADKVLKYEVGYLISPNLTEDKAKDVVAHIATLITKHDGVVESQSALSTQQLAYEIATKGVGKKSRFKTAYFGFTLFSMFSEELPAFTKALDKDSHIIRKLIIKKDRETVVLAPEEVAAIGPVVATDAPVEAEVVAPEIVVDQPVETKVDEVEIDKKIDSLVIS